MKRIHNSLLLIILVQFSFNSMAQSCFDEIANTEIPEKPHEMDNTDSERIEFMENTNCFLGEELDTIDLEITTHRSYLGVLIVFENIDSDVPITYARLKELMIEFTKKEEYPQIRKLHMLTRDFSMKLAIYENWETDKSILINLGIPEDKLEPFKNYLQKHPNTGKTYQELMMEFEASKATSNDH